MTTFVNWLRLALLLSLITTVLGCPRFRDAAMDDDDSAGDDDSTGEDDDATGDDDDSIGDDDDATGDDEDDEDDEENPFAGFYYGGTYITVETQFGPELVCDGELDVVVSDDGELFGDGGCWSGDSGEWDLTFSGEVKWDGSFAGEMVAISEQTGEVQGIAQGSMDFEGPESGFEGWALYSLVEVDFGGGPGPGGPDRECTVVAYGE